MEQKFLDLQKALGYKFKEEKNLIRALTHPTYSEVQRKRRIGARECPNQQTWATLGDAVLKTGLILLLLDRKRKTKGDITISKADIENNLKLAEKGERLKLLENTLVLEAIKNQEKIEEGSKTILADTVEALIGAIFLDSKCSIKKTKKSIEKLFAEELAHLERLS